MVESCEDEFLKFDLDYQQVLSLSLSVFIYVIQTRTHVAFSFIRKCSFVQIVVLRTKTAKEATLDILATHCIPSAMSDDLKS